MARSFNPPSHRCEFERTLNRLAAEEEARRSPTYTRREVFVLGGVFACALVGTSAAALARGITATPQSEPAKALPQTGNPVLIPEPMANVDSATAAAVSFTYETLDDLPWYLRLVNHDHPLPKKYRAPKRGALDSDSSMDERALKYARALLKAGHKEGVDPYVISSFRTRDYQKKLHERKVREYEDNGYPSQVAENRACGWVAKPGTSEHETGLALDIVDGSMRRLDRDQMSTDTQLWLMEHCWEFGFILRYPEGKSSITGVNFEPWHYRYVGEEAAAAITTSGLTFEEWLTGQVRVMDA